MSIEGQYRQGDVLLSRVGTKGSRFAELPDGLTERPADNGVVVLARGDSTGNPHYFEADARELVAADGQRFIVLTSRQMLRCPSHGPNERWDGFVEAGEYELTIQREMTDADEPRQVED